MTTGARARWFWVPPLLWAAMLFVLSSRPGNDYPDVTFPLADKLVHVALYAGLGFVCARAAQRGIPGSRHRVYWVAWVTAVLYGVADELHQRFVPGRSADWRDLIADAIGAAIGVALVRARAARH